jgi:Kef-type K+ transport system membrane component KefB
MDTILTSLLWAVLVAALAPVIRLLLPGPRLAAVVFMILGGILIGPSVLGWANPDDLEVLSDLGLGFLFLLAGYEIDLALFRERAGRLAIRGWLVSAGLALVCTVLLATTGLISSKMAIAIGLTTTALGTLLPLLQEANLLRPPFGPYVMTAGAAGEIFPIAAMAIFLSTKGIIGGLLSLILLGVATLGVLKIIDIGAEQRWGERLRVPEHSTSQATLRWTLVVLVLMLVIADQLSIDIVMGAFLAGLVLRYWSPGDMHLMEAKLDAVGYGVFIPIFFVSSGMTLDIDSIVEQPLRMLAFFVVIFVVRGLPTLWLYRADLSLSRRWELALFSATALPLLVALATVGVETGVMSTSDSAALIGAGVLSVIVFPTVALSLSSRETARTGHPPVLPPSPSPMG